MSRCDRTCIKLPQQWSDLIESFYGHQASMVRPCLAESADGVENMESAYPSEDDPPERDSDHVSDCLTKEKDMDNDLLDLLNQVCYTICILQTIFIESGLHNFLLDDEETSTAEPNNALTT